MIPMMLGKCVCAGLCICAAAVTGVAISNMYSNKTNENISPIDSIV